MRRLLTPGWLVRHGLAAALVVAFLGLGRWQIGRAASGNALSWAYAVQWPVFAGFVAFVWWREVQRDLRSAGGGRADRPDSRAATGSRHAATAPPAPARVAAQGFRPPVVTARHGRRYGDSPAGDGRPEHDADLTAYNHYLAWLNAHPGARPGDYPGR